MNTRNNSLATHLTLLLGMTGLALMASSCSTLSIDKKRVKESQKVAVLGFCVRQQIPNSALDNLMGKAGASEAIGAEFCEDKSHVTKMYGDFVEHLRSEFEFQVIDEKTLTSNPTYKALHQKYTEGWQHRPPARAGLTCYRAEGILDPFHIRNFSEEERQAVLTALGVDRIAIAEVEARVENTNMLKGLVGAADYSTETVMVFKMFTMDDPKKPIWSDTYAKGKSSKETVGGVLGFTQGNALDLATVASAKSSYQALSRRAKEAKE